MSISLGPQPIHAECTLVNQKGQVVGKVKMSEDAFWQTKIEIEVWGQKPNGLQGIHIHDLNGVNPNYCYNLQNLCQIPCDQLGGHYDPYQTNSHGDHTSDFSHRHVGDMGNIYIDDRGWGRKKFWDRLIRLRGTFSVINKAIVLHSGEDDLGHGNNKQSHITGNSGKKVACGIIRKK